MSVPKLAMIPSGYRSTKLYSVLPTDGTGDFTVSRNSTATRVNKDGLIELIANDIPRLDYANSNACPELLCEPQATQLLGYSNEFKNIYWNAPSNVIENATISPSGFKDADNVIGLINSNVIVTTTNYTCSFYAKKNTSESFTIRIDAPTNQTFSFNFNNPSSNMRSIGNGWFHCFFTFTSSLNGTAVIYFNLSSSDFYLYGVQLEVGNVATSYIPNATSGTITRLADVVTGQTNASNFNSAEGTLFVDIKDFGKDSAISISDGVNDNNTIQLAVTVDGLSIYTYVAVGGLLQYNIFHIFNKNQNNKIALRYSTNNYSFFVNGVKVNHQLSGVTFPSNTLSKLNLANSQGLYQFNGRLKQLQYFPTALTDTQLIELTT